MGNGINKTNYLRFFLVNQKKRPKKTEEGLESPVKKTAAIPLQGCAHAGQPHFASTIAFFVVDINHRLLRGGSPLSKWPMFAEGEGGGGGFPSTAGFTGLFIVSDMSENGCERRDADSGLWVHIADLKTEGCTQRL